MNFKIVAGEQENYLVIYQNGKFCKQTLWNIYMRISGNVLIKSVLQKYT